MIEDNKIILSVPCKVKFTVVVENSAQLVLPLLSGLVEKEFELNLKTILNEAFVNILKHCKPKPGYLAKIIYTIHSDRIKFEIFDPGKGLEIAQYFPPYPSTIVRTTQKLFKTLDGCVMAHVIDENTLSATFKTEDNEDIDRDEIIRLTKPGGLGIPIMTKLMDTVEFKYRENNGQVLTMVKYFQPNQ